MVVGELGVWRYGRRRSGQLCVASSCVRCVYIAGGKEEVRVPIILIRIAPSSVCYAIAEDCAPVVRIWEEGFDGGDEVPFSLNFISILYPTETV